MNFLRLRQVVSVTGLSRMTIWRLEQAGEFPRRRQLGPRSVAWLECDVERWMVSHPDLRRGALRSDHCFVSGANVSTAVTRRKNVLAFYY